MVGVITYLCCFLALCTSIDYSYAATKVFYTFNIQEAPKIANETDKAACNNTTAVETAEIITGSRSSLFEAPSNETDTTEPILYVETANFTYDNNEYHVKYNVSRVYNDGRLNGATLKILAG